MAHLHEHHCESCSHEHHHHEGHHHEHHHEAHEHHHEHEHHHHEHSLKKQLWLIIATVVLLIIAVLIEHGQFSHFSPLTSHLSKYQLLLVYLVPYLLIGHETLHEAWEGVMKGDAFNEHFLMSVATIGALLIGFLPGAETQYPEAVFVMLFFQIGELFEGYAEGKSRDSIAHLMDIRPDIAHVELTTTNDADYTNSEDTSEKPESVKSVAKTKDLSPEDVAVGSIIVIKPGEKVPLDGVVVEGTSALNTVALTGESLPRDVNIGDEVISGCVNLSGVLRVRTTKAFGESTVSKIISLVENAGERKSQSETFITRFARVYTFPRLALQSPDVPRGELSLCLGHQCASHFLRWYRRCIAEGYPHQGRELYGCAVEGRYGCFRQDGYTHPRPVCCHCRSSSWG